MNQIEASYARQRAEVEALVKQKQKEMEVETQRAALADFSAKQQIDTSNQLQRIQDDINKSTMTETERKYYDIAAASRDSAKSAIDAENSRRRSLGVAQMTAEEERRYYSEATKNSQKLIDKTKEHDRVSRDFSTGWSRAYKQYAEDAGNASKHAESMFSKATQGMEDAFVDFAKTGKFEWNDFLASLAEEALRYELKGIFADIMAGKADAKSTLDQLQGAIGNKIGANKPASQGGATSEDMLKQLGSLYGGMGAAKNQAPQGAIGSRPIQNNPTPPPVPPTTNNITYTINAVDAPSFKQLVAQDPAFIYAVTVQGARTLAGRR
jgi:lambda family phage tail tape measure protein